MIKNVYTPSSLLAFLIIFLFAACSSPRSYSHTSKKRDRTERRSETRSTKKRTRSARTTASASASSAAKSNRSKIVKTAKKYMGKPYVYGGKKPSSGFDCSGFTAHVYKENGIPVSGPSHQQAKQGKKKSIRDLKQGDLVFFGKGSKVSHVGIVASADRGKLEVIHSTSSRGVVIDDITNSSYWKKRYLFGRDVLN